MLSTIYTFLMHVYGLACLPKVLIRSKGRPFGSWFGQGAPQKVGNKPVIWLHAPSMGETRAIAPLVHRLRSTYPDSTIVATTVTATGQAEAKRVLTACDHVFYMPFDLSYLIQPLIKRLKPDLVILCETDFWYAFLSAAKQVGAHVAVVNGKISQRSARRFGRIPRFAKRLLGLIDILCVQDTTYRQRFLDLGVSPDRLYVTGNLKLEALPQKTSESELSELRHHLQLDAADRIVVVGSTHDPEEEQLLHELIPLLAVDRHLKIIIVPRHPERFGVVSQVLESTGFSWGRYSSPQGLTGTERLLLIDKMGILNRCYALGELAIVGGSFTDRVGGHNVLEPLAQGVPVLFGPHMHAQQQMAAQLLAGHAGRQVSLRELTQEVRNLLSSDQARQSLVAAGESLLDQLRGALDRTWKTFPLRHIADSAKVANQLTRGGAVVSSLGS